MNNKNRLFRVTSLLLVLCFVSTAMISGTFAKYTNEYAGQDTALVARWNFEVTDGTTDLGAPDAEPIQSLDLFSHLYNTNINQKDGNDYIIAPGVNDVFTIEMNFLSDVDAKVTVDFTKAGTVADGLPIEYLVLNDDEDNTDWVALGDLPEKFAAMVVAENPSLTAAAAPADNTFTFYRSGIDDDTADTITQVVKWRWAFDATEQPGTETSKGYTSDDDTDTGFGNASAAGGATRTTYILNVSVAAEQIAPTTP